MHARRHQALLLAARRLWPLAAALALPGLAQERAGRASPNELEQQVRQVAGQVRASEANLRVLETEYTEHPEQALEDSEQRHFAQGQARLAAKDYPGAALLFDDLISDAHFRRSDAYPQALRSLAECLAQEGNLLGARLYLRQLLSFGHARYPETLQRYLEIAAQLRDFSDVDVYLIRARDLTLGQLPDGLAYAYGKWLFEDTPLPVALRLTQAERQLAHVARAGQPPYRILAEVLLGVIDVQRHQLPQALAHFERAAKDPAAKSPRERKAQEQANLAWARVDVELGRYDEAIDRYQEVKHDSDNFPDALYETAWAQVRKGHDEAAKTDTEILAMVAPDSRLLPQAQLLHAHLLLKLRQYPQAARGYDAVLNAYAPVRDELDALLDVNRDPVTYFDNLLSRSDHNLDVSALLPPAAVKYATAQRQVAEAVRTVKDLEDARRALADSSGLIGQLLEALDRRGLDAFPAIQDGFSRADAIDRALTRSDQALLGLESYLAEDALSAQERARLTELGARARALQSRFAALPASEAARLERRRRRQARVDALTQQTFPVGLELQGASAILVATRKWVGDSRPRRHDRPQDEEAFMVRVQLEQAQLDDANRQLAALRQRLGEERALAQEGPAVDETVRGQFRQVLQAERALLGQVEPRLTPEQSRVYTDAEAVLDRAGAVQERIALAQANLRQQIHDRTREIRRQLLAEQSRLNESARQAQAIAQDARQVVGKMAFDSFRRVRNQFYDLVLKADVGLIDVAFTRKQDQTTDIQKLAAQKERALHALDREFKGVLEDED